jgi:hypothetical protein
MFILRQRLFLDDYNPWQRRRFVSARSTKDERQEDGIVAHHCMEIRPAGATNQEMTSLANFLCSRTSRDVWRIDLPFALQCHCGLSMTD